MRIWPAAGAMLLAAAVAIGVMLLATDRPWPELDVVELNDLQHRVAADWGAVDAATVADLTGPISVVAADGTVVFARAGAPTDELAAAELDAAALPVVVDGARVGTVFRVDEERTAARAARERTVTGLAIGAVVAVAVIGMGLLGWLWARILRPFARLRTFAARIAGGDLDTPLGMDRGHAFGAFTESFDLMRSELAASRAREEELRASKQALVAQLSHDIRTPLASIAAVAELLEIGEADPGRAARLSTIGAKTAQIDALVAELFRANRDELEALPVHVEDHPAADLADLIAAADIVGTATVAPPPQCLVSYDERRMQQVLDNVLSNAGKYAGTPVTVDWRVGDESAAGTGVLRVTIADRGPGVADDEVGLLLGRGVRGSNAAGAPGQGLGLHTSAWLMERMGGALAVRNTHPGFAVDLDVRLS